MEKNEFNPLNPEQKVSARYLLDLFINFKFLEQNRDNWNEEALRNNAPRMYRFRMLTAMQKAFDAGDKLSDLEYGNFTLARNESDYFEIYDRYLQKYNEFRNKSINQRMFVKDSMQSLYKSLFFYLSNIHRAFGAWDGFGEMFHMTAFGMLAAEKITADIKENIEPIADILTEILDPHGRTFTIGELNEGFGFPIVDLKKVDLDCF